jgi:hypothetical protein
MADDHWFSPDHHPLTVPQKPKPTEPLWTLRKGTATVDCRLLGHGEWGWEIQLYRDGGFYAGRRFNLRAEAIDMGTS